MRFRRWLLRLVVFAVLLWGVLLGVEYFAFAGERRLADWTWPEPTSQLATGPAPRYEAKPNSRQLLFLEHDLLAPDSLALSERTRDLTNELRGSPTPVRADLVWLRASTTIRTALWVAQVHGPAIVVVTISARDVVWNDRDEIAGVPQPRLHEQDGGIAIVRAEKKPESNDGLDPLLREVPMLRLLVDRPALLPSKTGLFPTDLWPFRRGGTRDEAKRYRATELALRFLKTSVTATAGRLAVLYVPCTLEVGRASRGDCHEALGLTSREIESARVRRRLADITKQLGIVWIDPILALEKASRHRGDLYAGDSRLAAPLTARGRRILMRVLGPRLVPLLGG